MRSASSVIASTGALAYASLIRMPLNEKPSTPSTAHAGPIHAASCRALQGQRGRRAVAQSHRTTPAYAVTRISAPNDDAVPRERREVVAAHVAQQPAHAQERRDERGDEADAERRQVGGGEQVPVLHGLVDACGEERGNREEERELGRRLARESEQHAADDRRARARGAGNERERLREADLQRVGPAHRVDVVDAHGIRARALPPLGPQDHERADDERDRDRHRARTATP